MTNGLERVDEDIRTLRGDLGGRLDRLEARTDARFDGVDRRFDAVDRRFEAVDRRFDAVDGRFDSMDARFDALHRMLFRTAAAGFVSLLVVLATVVGARVA